MDEIPASSDLSDQIIQALDDSAYLIVVCSPDTPVSAWIRREITHFQENGRGDRILALLVDGEPSQSFPPELRLKPPDDSESDGVAEEVEPVAADVRPRGDERTGATHRRALLRIAAGLLGCRFDDLARRNAERRARRRRSIAAGMAACLAVILGGAGYWWDQARLKTDHYIAYEERWGVPRGIGPVDEKMQNRRGATFAIDSRGGRVIGMRSIKGSGTATDLDGDNIFGEPWMADVATWLFGL